MTEYVTCPFKDKCNLELCLKSPRDNPPCIAITKSLDIVEDGLHDLAEMIKVFEEGDATESSAIHGLNIGVTDVVYQFMGKTLKIDPRIVTNRWIADDLGIFERRGDKG